MNHLDRTFLFNTRPHHRETLDSYTRRLLTANFEPASLQDELLRATDTHTGTATQKKQAWVAILQTKTGRTLRFDHNEHGWLRHRDGTSCERCIDLISRRYLCTQCSHGAEVQQTPHFDAPVCTRHRRWVGFDQPHDTQEQVGQAHLEAARTFTKLRDAHRLDVRLYLVLTAALMTNRSGLDERGAFPHAVSIAAAVTAPDLLRRILDPANPFAESYATLGGTVRAALGREAESVTRAIWLYLRSTAATIRTAITAGTRFAPHWEHDFPLDPALVDQFWIDFATVEPFSHFLSACGDDPHTAQLFDRQRFNLPALAATAIPRVEECSKGHHFTPAPSQSSEAPTKCPACAIARRAGAHNNLEAVAPKIAAELDTEHSYGLIGVEIPAGSRARLAWRCPKEHRYYASPMNRTLNDQGCAVCLNRVIVAGINDLATHGGFADEWHPGTQNQPTEYAPASMHIVDWLCSEGHMSTMSIFQRGRLDECPACKKTRPKEQNIVITHPGIAADWHPTKNSWHRVDSFTHGSKHTAYWLCPEGHTYACRIERRTAFDQGCTTCRKLRKRTKSSSRPDAVS